MPHPICHAGLANYNFQHPSRRLPSSLGLCLFPRHLLLHLPPRLQDHLVAPLLQQRLPLVLVGAPLLCRRCGILVRRLLELVLQVEALYEIRLGGLVCGGSCGGRGGRGGVRAGRRWGLEGDGWLAYKTASVWLQCSKSFPFASSRGLKTYSLYGPTQNLLRRRRNAAPIPLQIPQDRPPLHLWEHLLDPLDRQLALLLL